MNIIVISCDKNEDLFKPFYHCIEKYWPNHPEIVYSTESVINPYYKTIPLNYDLEHWTDRVRETVKKIDDDYILFMVDDIFIRETVDNERVLSLCKYLTDKYANINLQLNGDRNAKFVSDELLERSFGKWNLCCMCTLWKKDAMLDLFDYSTDPWSFEQNNYIKDYKFLISKTGDVINWGRKSNKEWHWGIMKGKWTQECVKFFIKEELDKDIDFSKRGLFYPEEKYYFMQLAGDCSGMGYLGNNRLKGPVDNVITKGDKCIQALLEDTYYETVITQTPKLMSHKVWFDGDSDTTYDYDIVQIVHNHVTDKNYQNELKARCILFKDFYKNVLTKNNYYFTVNFNSFDLDSNNEEIDNNIEKTIKTLIEYNILDKVIFVGLKATRRGHGNKHPINIEHYKKLYNSKYVEIENNDVWNPAEIERCHNQFLTQFKENIKVKKCFGIISYFPWDQPERKQRQDRLERLIKQLSDFWPNVPIMIITQQWKYFTLEGKCKNKVIRFDYEKLGILGARQALRKHFLESEFDYLIMFDDDAIIEKDYDNVLVDYMEKIDKHPEGFCFIKGTGSSPYVTYNDSQLNLCAISRYIYEHEPIPNIDPQKSEGFEDRIWSTLLHYKYADKEFDAPAGIRCVHFKNVDEIVPSTWANQQKYNWKQLRENTLEIEKYIIEYKELPDLKTFLNILSDANVYQSSAQELNSQKLKKDTDLKSNINVNINKSTNIDLVVTYVDSTDKEWQKIYTKYAPISEDVQVTGKQRFRNNPHFKYLFRGIEKYAPWINNVFLIVQSYSQVPKWINQERVKIILHEDIIPSEYLPVFNSQAIEMFLHKIPDLSEKFLYSNDDMYFVGDMHPEDFFTEDNKVKTSFHFYSYDSNKDIPLWKKALINSAMLTNKIEAEELKHEGKCLTPMHSIRPYFKSKIEEVHEQYSTEIFNSISKFRESKNFTVYLYDFYLKSLGLTVNTNYSSTCFSSISSISLVCTAIINPHLYKTICINDTKEEEDRKRIATITEHFESQFPNLSKYEVLN